MATMELERRIEVEGEVACAASPPPASAAIGQEWRIAQVRSLEAPKRSSVSLYDALCLKPQGISPRTGRAHARKMAVREATSHDAPLATHSSVKLGSTALLIYFNFK